MAVLTVKTLPYLIIREASRRNEVDPVPADSSVVSAVIPTSLFSGKLPILVLTACQMALKGCNYFADEHYFISPQPRPASVPFLILETPVSLTIR